MKRVHLQRAQTLFLLAAAVLTVFGTASLLRIPGTPSQAGLYAFYGLAMFADAAVLLLCAWLLGRRTRFAFVLLVIVPALNMVLTIFDQVGWVDMLFMLLNLVLLVAVILARKEFVTA